jgi:soluble lytic murein transglycosylase-like protein
MPNLNLSDVWLLVAAIMICIGLVSNTDPYEPEAAIVHAEEIAPAPTVSPFQVAIDTKQPNPVADAVFQAARHAGVDAELLLAMARVESNLNPEAVSHAGAVGVLQVVPHTAGREVYRLRGLPGTPEMQKLLDPTYNAKVAAEYLSWLKGHFGTDDPEIAVAAFNAGPARVRSCLRRFGRAWKSCLPMETQQYLVKIDREVGGLRQI